MRPSLLLLDEPFAAPSIRIYPGAAATVFRVVFSRRRFSFIVVTHSFEEAVFLGRQILVLDNGARIKTTLHNPGAGDPEYRRTPEFFRQSLRLRNTLEDS